MMILPLFENRLDRRIAHSLSQVMSLLQAKNMFHLLVLLFVSGNNLIFVFVV